MTQTKQQTTDQIIILSQFNKLLKKLMFNRLYSYLEKYIYLQSINMGSGKNYKPFIAYHMEYL